MIKKAGIILAQIGAKLWENNGFWIDKVNDVAQEDYKSLPLLGKVGYHTMTFGLKLAKVKF